MATSTSKSSPYSMAATSERTPEIISFIRISMGWVMAIRWPGRSRSSFWINSVSSSWVCARFHSLPRLAA